MATPNKPRADAVGKVDLGDFYDVIERARKEIALNKEVSLPNVQAKDTDVK